MLSVCMFTGGGGEKGHSNLGHQESWEKKLQSLQALTTGLCTYLSLLRKLKKTHYELVAKKNQFSTKEEFFKVATEEIDRYK